MHATQALQSRRGNYSIIMGGTIITTLGFAALAVDISLITMAELQCQGAADAASHAALVAYRNSAGIDPVGDGTAAANFMVDRNPVAFVEGDLDAVEFGSYDRLNDTFCTTCVGSINAARAQVSRNGTNAVDLLLAPMFGVFTHNVDANSITAQQKRAIMLVQDWSCSMETGSYPRPIDISRYANYLFLDYMVTNAQDGDMLGVAGYAEWAPTSSLGRATSIIGLEYWDNTPAPRPWGHLTSLDTLAGVAYIKGRISAICAPGFGCPDDALTETNTTMLAPVQALASTGGIGTCTNPEIAMRQATRELEDYTDNTYFRGMLVMSDGEFNCRGDDAGAISAANYAYDNQDISIWTIGYSGGSLNADAMRAITKGFGFYQESPDFADLPAMYATVAESLPTAIVD